MWWAISLLLAGSFSDMVQDPAAMRFCAASAEIALDETAAAHGKGSDEVRYQQEIVDLFVAQLRKLGAADAAALAATKRAIGESDEDLAQADRCGQLATVTPTGGDLAQAAAELDTGWANGDPASEAADAAVAALREPRR